MLGSMLIDTFASNKEFGVIVTYRDSKAVKFLINKYPKVEFRKLDVEKADLTEIKKAIKGANWVINAIGITKPFIKEDGAFEINRAIEVNSHFPHHLAQAAKDTRAKVIQIATDCVYSGQKGRYVESDIHDAYDVYGKTKSLGEVYADNFFNLRCSIVGPEPEEQKFLLEWFLNQPKKAKVEGFKNHHWNGITTLHFARICRGIIENSIALPHIQHIIPGDSVTKAGLLTIFAKEFRRRDIKIHEKKAGVLVNRTLSTNNEKLNRRLWKMAGYKMPPKISEMIRELAQSI